VNCGFRSELKKFNAACLNRKFEIETALMSPGPAQPRSVNPVRSGRKQR